MVISGHVVALVAVVLGLAQQPAAPTTISPVCADISVSLTAITPRVKIGERPQFGVALSNGTNRAVRILDVRGGRRPDLQNSYLELFVARGPAVVTTPIAISDPGPLSATDFFDLQPGERVSIHVLSYAREFERLEPGAYQAFILFWRDPMEPHTTRCRSTRASFVVHK
jgi:hypothetical protein